MSYDRGAFVVVSADDLPEPDWPFRCPVAKPLGPQAGEYSGEQNQRWHARRPTLTNADVAQCPYHEPNWRTISAIATAALAEVAVLDDPLIEMVAMRMEATPEEAAHAQSLFHRPIRVHGQSGMYSDGIHRACALKCAAVPGVPVVRT
jgi:hypothetical protein